MTMMFVSLFSWWYTVGWLDLVQRVGLRIERVLKSFSVGLLLKTLFSPYRQISAGSHGRTFDAQMRAFGDRLFSRIFGAIIRTIFIVIGTVGASVVAVAGIFQIIAWPFVPFLPAIGLVLMAMGVEL